MRIAITAPTGNVGRKVVHELLERGQRDLVLLARDPDKLAAESKRGASIAHGDLTDQDFVDEALRGADAVLWVIPPNPQAPDLRTYQDELARIGATAARENNVGHVVLLSSMGAEQTRGTGPILGLHDAEEIFRVAVRGLTILRAAMFMENYLMQMESIRAASMVRLPISGEARVPMIATEDIARAAADALLGKAPDGWRVVNLVGPKSYSFDEAASIIGKTIGRPVQHVRITDEQAVQQLIDHGVSANVAQRMLEMYDGIDRGLLHESPEGEAKKTPTTFEQFAQTAIRPAVGAG